MNKKEIEKIGDLQKAGWAFTHLSDSQFFISDGKFKTWIIKGTQSHLLYKEAIRLIENSK